MKRQVFRSFKERGLALSSGAGRALFSVLARYA